MQLKPAQPAPPLDAAPPKRSRRLRPLVLGLGALAVMSVIVGTALSLWRMHDEVSRLAEEHLLGLAQILGEQTLRSTQAVDALLRAAAKDAHLAGAKGLLAPSKELHERLRETIAQTPFVSAVILSDAEGRVIVHTFEFPPPPIDHSDSEFFRAYRERLGTHSATSQPVVGKLAGERGLAVSRALIDADGRFFGVITALVDPAYFLGRQGLRELGPDGAVRLLRRDGMLLTGHPAAIAAARVDDLESAMFTEGVDAGRALVRHVDAGSAGERISAIRPIEGYPLAVVVSSSMNFVLHTWHRTALLFGAIAAAGALLLALITLSLAHQLRVDEELKSVLLESEQRLNAIIQSAMDGIIIADKHKRIVMFNAAAELIFRCASAKAIGADIGRFIRWHMLDAQPGSGEEAATGRKMGQQLALTGVRTDGAEFALDASISQVWWQGADLYIVILRDVTERRQVEAALRGNEQRYRTLFSKAMDGILLLDTQGNIVDANDAFARMHGYAIGELIHRHLRELDTPEALALAPERFRRIALGESLGFEVEHYHQDGHVVPLDVAASAMDIDGKLYVLAFHRDITERKRAEQEIKRSHEALRRLSKAANEALEAERRRTARELHDELGQSLTALKMDLESLRSALAPGQADLEDRTQTMHALLDGTIAATRRIAADLRPLMLDDLGLAAALDWLTHNFSKHTGIATDLIIDDSVAQVPEPIASALYRITQESLTNVAKYAQATTAEIRVERDADWVQLLVRDNGRGIAAADQDKGGTFGLLGIRERVALLGGEVAIHGESGRGSEVRARIPLAAASVGALG